MYDEKGPIHTDGEPRADVFHLRPDVVKALRNQPPVNFDELYEKLKQYDAEYALQLMADAEKYSHDIREKKAFAAGVMHALHAQIASYEVDELEAVFSGDDGGAGQLPSDVPGDGQPIA